MPDIVPNLYTSKGCVQTTNRGQDAYKIIGRAPLETMEAILIFFFVSHNLQEEALVF